MGAKTEAEIEYFVGEFGEQHRKIIVDALGFLDNREPTWKLDKPIDRHQYLVELIKGAKR